MVMLIWAHGHMATFVSAQSTGTLRFRFSPENGVSYVLDGKYRMSDREVTLLEGPHRFVFWAPERRMMDTTLTVLAGRTIEVELALRYSVEYIDHRRAVERYARNLTWARMLPPAVALGTGIWAGASYLRYAKAHQDLKDLEESYRTSADPGGIRRLKAEDIPRAKDVFAKARTGAILSGGAFAASVAATAYLRRRTARSCPPVFDDRERLRFEGLAWVPSNNGGIWAAGLSIQLR